MFTRKPPIGVGIDQEQCAARVDDLRAARMRSRPQPRRSRPPGSRRGPCAGVAPLPRACARPPAAVTGGPRPVAGDATHVPNPRPPSSDYARRPPPAQVASTRSYSATVSAAIRSHEWALAFSCAARRMSASASAVRGHLLYRLRHRRRVARLHQPPVVTLVDGLRRRPDARGQRRQARSHGLEQRDAAPLRVAGKDQDLAAGEEPWKVLVRIARRHADAVAQLRGEVREGALRLPCAQEV